MRKKSDKANPWSGAIKKIDPGKVRYDDMRRGEGQNGKGDWIRNLGPRFLENFDKIDWSK